MKHKKSVTESESNPKSKENGYKSRAKSKSKENEEPTRSKSKSKMKDTENEEKLKRPMNAYFLFAKDERPNVEKDGFQGREILSELGKRWEACDEKKRKNRRRTHRVAHRVGNNFQRLFVRTEAEQSGHHQP